MAPMKQNRSGAYACVAFKWHGQQDPHHDTETKDEIMSPPHLQPDDANNVPHVIEGQWYIYALVSEVSAGRVERYDVNSYPN
jgi:hypothetical protein